MITRYVTLVANVRGIATKGTELIKIFEQQHISNISNNNDI